MARSLIYERPWVYRLLMRLLYGRHHNARFRAVADWIPAGAQVLELCCGPGELFEQQLRAKNVAYTGLDINRPFLARVARRGGEALEWDLADDRPLPAADVVVMQASLYQFLPDPAPLVRRMLAAARRRVVIAEPIRNLSDAGIPLLSAYAREHTDAGLGLRASRYNEATLDAFIRGLDVPIAASFLVDGGREKVYVLEALRS